MRSKAWQRTLLGGERHVEQHLRAGKACGSAAGTDAAWLAWRKANLRRHDEHVGRDAVAAHACAHKPAHGELLGKWACATVRFDAAVDARYLHSCQCKKHGKG